MCALKQPGAAMTWSEGDEAYLMNKVVYLTGGDQAFLEMDY